MTFSDSIRSKRRNLERVRLESANIEALIRKGGFRLGGRHRLVIGDGQRRAARAKLFHNPVTTAEKNYLLQCGLANAAAAITTWYAGMIAENRDVSDGAIMARQATLTSSTASFVAGDAGRQITVFGAGTAGANLVTTIPSLTNGTTVVLATNAGTTVTGLLVLVGPLLAATGTMSSHSGWRKVAASQVQQATRQTWMPGTVRGGSVNDSATPAAYRMSASLAGTAYIHGLSLVSNNTIADTTGTQHSEDDFPQSALGVQADYSVSDTYTVSLN